MRIIRAYKIYLNFTLSKIQFFNMNQNSFSFAQNLGGSQQQAFSPTNPFANSQYNNASPGLGQFNAANSNFAVQNAPHSLGFGQQQGFGVNQQNSYNNNVNGKSSFFTNNNGGNQSTLGSPFFTHSNNSFGSGSQQNKPFKNSVQNGSMTGMGSNKFEPLRSANPKIDSKHVVKCVAISNENRAFCLKELRTKHIMMQPQTGFGAGSFNTPTSSFGFGFPAQNQSNQAVLSSNNMQTGFGNSTGLGLNNGSSNQNSNMSNQSSFSLGNGQKQNTTQFGTGFFGQSNCINTQSPTNPGFYQNTNNSWVQSNNSFATQPFPASANNSGGQASSMIGTSIFPPLLANPSRTPQINNAAVSLAATAITNQFNQMNSLPTNGVMIGPGVSPLGNVNGPSPNSMMGPIFGNAPLQLSTQEQNMIIYSLLNSDALKNLVSRKKTEPFDKVSDHLNGKKRDSSCLSFRLQQNQEQLLEIQRTKRVKKENNFYHQPYEFCQIKNDSDSAIYKKLNPKDIKESKAEIIDFSQQILKKADIITKIIPSFPQCHVHQGGKAEPGDLPVNDSMLLFLPSMDKLVKMTAQELKRVSNFSIENKFGRVKFNSPVSLYQKTISECIVITQDSIQIRADDWEGKPCQMLYRNFSNYRSANESERKNIQRKMKRWVGKNNLELINFDQLTGDLTVELTF